MGGKYRSINGVWVPVDDKTPEVLQPFISEKEKKEAKKRLEKEK